MHGGYTTGLAALLIAVGSVTACSCSNNNADGPPAGPDGLAVPSAYPLTGRQPTDPALAIRPALSVKIDNSGPGHPQAGLNSADIVNEQLVEGGLTRLLATFQSADARVGPIRSARPVDAGLLRQLGGGIFAYSGAAEGGIAPVRAVAGTVLLSDDELVGKGADTPFTRSTDRTAPYNVFATTAKLYAAGYARDAARRPPPQVFAYSTSPARSARPATTVTMAFSPISERSWNWDGSHQQWIRVENGRPDVLEERQQVATTNVVILSVAIRPIPGFVDAAGNPVPDITLTGEGPCWVLRDGKVISGRWSRATPADTGKLLDASGAIIALAPGRTWIELLPRPNQPQIR